MSLVIMFIWLFGQLSEIYTQHVIKLAVHVTDDAIHVNGKEVNLSITDENYTSYNSQPRSVQKYVRKLRTENYHLEVHTLIKNGVLMRYVTDNKQTFETIVLPQYLTGQVLKKHIMNWVILALHGLQNMLLEGLKPATYKHVRQYHICQKRN